MIYRTRPLHFLIYISTAVAILTVTSIFGSQMTEHVPTRVGRALRFITQTTQKSEASTKEPVKEKTRHVDELLQQKLVAAFGQNYRSSKRYQNIINKCGEDRNTTGKVRFFDTSPYIYNPQHICYGKRPDVLIAVHTAPSHADRRNMIRKTYGAMSNIRGWTFAVVYFLGRPSDAILRNASEIEAETHQDIVMRNYTDSYRNLTYKHASVYDWISQYCPNLKFLIKVDDDVFVNVFHVVNYLNAYKPGVYYCSRTTGTKPMRKYGKWAVTKEEYKPDTYPPYCMGYGYMMRAKHVKDVYWCSVYSKFFWVDDILFGGLIPQKLKYDMTPFFGGYGLAYVRPSLASHEIANQIFILSLSQRIAPELFEKFWRKSIQYSY